MKPTSYKATADLKEHSFSLHLLKVYWWNICMSPLKTFMVLFIADKTSKSLTLIYELRIHKTSADAYWLNQSAEWSYCWGISAVPSVEPLAWIQMLVYDQSSIAPLGRIKYLALNWIKFSRKGFSYILQSIYIFVTWPWILLILDILLLCWSFALQ